MSLTCRIVVLQLRDDQTLFQVACSQGIDKYFVGLLRGSVVGNLGGGGTIM